jgi:hypothetical protein
MRPSIRELATVIADTLPRQSWPRRWELLRLVGKMVWFRVKIGWFLVASPTRTLKPVHCNSGQIQPTSTAN